MNGFKSDKVKDALKSENFRQVLYTDRHLQLVLMRFKPVKDIDEEYHFNNFQFFRFEDVKGKNVNNGNENKEQIGDAIFVTEESNHKVINSDPLKELKMLQSMTLLTIKTASLIHQKKMKTAI
jgi:mannose-6-phosphate isomerase-like protein (cupin superfamily)